MAHSIITHPMSKSLVSFAIVALLFMTSCSDSEKTAQTGPAETTDLTMPAAPPCTPGLAKKLVEENNYIDVDIKALLEALRSANQKSQTLDESKSDEVAKAKAVTYRFMSHVTVTDGKFVLDNSTAKSLNIPEEAFNILKQNIDDINSAYKKWKEEGQDIPMPSFTEEDLKALLD